MSLYKKSDVARCVGDIKESLNAKFHTICDQDGKSICLLLSAAVINDDKCAGLLLPVLPNAQKLIAGKDIDIDWFRLVLLDKNIHPSIPSLRVEPQASF